VDPTEDEYSEVDEERDTSIEPQHIDVDRYYLSNWKVCWKHNSPRPTVWNIDLTTQSYDALFTISHTPPASMLKPSRDIWYPFQLLRNVMATFKRSSTLKAILKAQQQGEKNPLTILAACETRWGTTFEMTDRFLELVPSLIRMTLEPDRNIKPHLVTAIRQLISNIPLFNQFLRFWSPFQQLQLKLQSETKPTAGHVLPELYNALDIATTWIPASISCASAVGLHINHNVVTHFFPQLNRLINSIPNTTFDLLKHNFAVAARASAYWKDSCELYLLPLLQDPKVFPKALRYATILTPIHKKLEFLHEEDRNTWYSELGEIIQDMTKPHDPLSGYRMPASPAYPHPESELTIYLNLQHTLDHNDETHFWFVGPGRQLKAMSQAFRRFGCIPASSAPSERFFSLAGNTCTKKRNRLSSQTLETITICHRNIKSLVSAGLPDPSLEY